VLRLDLLCWRSTGDQTEPAAVMFPDVFQGEVPASASYSGDGDFGFEYDMPDLPDLPDTGDVPLNERFIPVDGRGSWAETVKQYNEKFSHAFPSMKRASVLSGAIQSEQVHAFAGFCNCMRYFDLKKEDDDDECWRHVIVLMLIPDMCVARVRSVCHVLV
jgi:hypothetical protein